MEKLIILNTTNIQSYFKLVIIALITFLCLFKTNSLDSYPTGDGPEYILTTEAFYRHLTPDLRSSDSRSFKKAYKKRSKWENVYKSNFFDLLESFLAKPDKFYKENFAGIYRAKNGKLYGYHFFSYSLLNVPARYFLGLLHKNPLACFKYTNAFLIILSCAILLFITPFNFWISSIISLSFFYSSVYWYLGWTHPEVFTSCLVAISLWLFFQNYNFIPIILMSIAATQNQPLVFFVIVLAILVLARKKLNLKSIITVGLCCSIVTIPSLFFYYHFDTFNLIKDEGFLDTQFQTFTRIFGFYFDINQGAVLAIPLVLLLYFPFLIRKVFLSIKQKTISLYVDFSILIALTALTLTLVTMINWNHGQAVINRYASWVSTIVFIHFMVLMKDFPERVKLTVLSSVFVMQVFTVLYHEKHNLFDYGLNKHKPLAEWVLSNHPSWYNPDPTIFGIRTTNGYNINPETSPIVFFNKKNEVCKIMTLKDRLNDLVAYGIPVEKIKDFKTSKKSINGWMYINKGDYIPTKNHEDIYNLALYKIAINTIIPNIKASETWYNQVKEKSKGWNVSEDSALVIDALYVLKLSKENK